MTGQVNGVTAEALNKVLRDLGAFDQPAANVVLGQVYQSDGGLFAGSIVRAFDKDLRSEELLGEATADQEGRYEITYTAEQFLFGCFAPDRGSKRKRGILAEVSR